MVGRAFSYVLYVICCGNLIVFAAIKSYLINMSYFAERALSWMYPTVISSSVICCITSGILWSHWRYVLNACPETNCGCFLYARSTYTSFEGGSIAYCYYATYGLLIPLAVSVIFGAYHVYRICLGIAKPKTGTTTIRQRSGEIVVLTAETDLNRNDISPYYWMPMAILSGIMCLYTLVYASLFTDGFGTTCKQYRESLLKEIQGVGNIVPVIKSRLSCSAIFDFMDYLVESISYERRKYGRINSSISIHFTLIFAWIALFAWFSITIVNIVQMRRTRSARL